MRRVFLFCVFALLAICPGRGGDLRLNLDHSSGQAKLQLSADPGVEYLIESASDSVSAWKPLTSFILTDASRLWTDASANLGNRFFRARSLTPSDANYPYDFRLIDQNGVSRQLYYYDTLTSLKGIVVVFAQGNYSQFASKIASLKATNSSLLFWTIETGATNTRPSIRTDALSAGITWPVYHDPMQLIARDFDPHFNGEAFLISRAEMRVVYRGVIDDGTSNYLGAAIASLVGGQPIITTRVEPNQNAITRVSRAVADYPTVIAPLLQTKCVVCHSAENIAPIALTNYEAVVAYADSIKTEVLEKNMPPWHADPVYGKFHNDISMSNTETARLIDWINAGSPRGTGPDPLINVPPPPPDYPPELGPPDQIVTIPVQQIPATGVLAYRYIYANATNATDKWLKAAFVRPSNKRVVHHYIVWQGHSTFAQLSGIAAYAPGRSERPFPDGTGVLLPANCDLTFNCHYTADGKDEVDQPQLLLWYASTPPAKQMQTAAIVNVAFTFGQTSIPAGASDYEVTASQTFSSPVRIYSLAPHMHFRGLRMRFELTVPGGAKQIILSVPKYNFDWQTIYSLETPLDIPANSRIDVIGGFDNSAQNLDNPNSTIPVKWGEQSWDEMFIGYIEYSAQ
jgi:hypothetical protein